MNRSELLKGLEDRVGFRTTAILEGYLNDYIHSFTVNNKYVGDVLYLQVYRQVKQYNDGGLLYETGTATTI